MAIKSGIFNSVGGDRIYKAEDFAAYFASFIGNGVFPNPSNGFQVIAGSGMSVNLKAGKAWINGYYATNDGDYNLQLDVADGVLNRIDRVVLQLNYLNRTIIPVVKKGTFASTPVAPAIKRDADAYEIALADIRINKGAFSISQANITDLRLNTELCGIVHGVVDQVDTTTIFNQYQSWYNQFTVQKAGEFEAWLARLEDILDGDVAGNLLNQITVVDERLEIHENNIEAHGIGDRTELLTTEKTTLIGAVNELFTNANDGKIAVANAVTAKGVPASPADPFATLANKIGQISTGKKWASGITPINPTLMQWTTITGPNSFSYMNTFGIKVTGLSFKPSTVILYAKKSDGALYNNVTTYNENLSIFGNLLANGIVSLYESASSKDAWVLRIDGTRNSQINSDGFQLPVHAGSTAANVTWIAYE